MTFSTGLCIGTASTRSRKSAGALPSSRPRTRRASALQTTARAAIAVPSSSSTPSPGWIAATGAPVVTTAPASRAASAIAKETRPIPPRT